MVDVLLKHYSLNARENGLMKDMTIALNTYNVAKMSESKGGMSKLSGKESEECSPFINPDRPMLSVRSRKGSIAPTIKSPSKFNNN